jgi:hypothetical protein
METNKNNKFNKHSDSYVAENDSSNTNSKDCDMSETNEEN